MGFNFQVYGESVDGKEEEEEPKDNNRILIHWRDKELRERKR